MPGRDFVHLHVHSEYSVLDGHSRLPALAARARELEMPALGLTDHGSLSGAYKHYKACNDAGVKPIIGIEAYVAPGSRHDKVRAVWGEVTDRGRQQPVPGPYTHLTVLAQDAEGLRNLYRLQRAAHAEGFYQKPRIDLELLAAHAGGLIVLSGCPGSELSTRVRLGQEDLANELIDFYKQTFQERFFIEIMDHGIKDLEGLNKALLTPARLHGVPVVATNDTHYTLREDSRSHDALLCVQTKTTLDDPNRFAFTSQEFFLKSREEMHSIGFDRVPLDNSLVIAEMVSSYSSVFERGSYMPPGEFSELKDRAYDGVGDIYNSRANPEGPSIWEYMDRLQYELQVIHDLGYTGYILCIADIIAWAKLQGIMVGPGRGSAGASLVCYALGLTAIDPLEHGLVFERFLNPSRVSPPDFDIDIQEDRRDEVIAYAVDRYGDDRVAQIITFGTEGSRSAIRDAARVLGRPASVGTDLAGMVPDLVRGRQLPLAEVPDIGKVDQDVYRLALSLEGLVRSEGRHAAGIVVLGSPALPDGVHDDEHMVNAPGGGGGGHLHHSVEPHSRHDGDQPGQLSDLGFSGIIPMKRGPNDQFWATAFENSELESLGIIKYDLLGLKNLTVIDQTLRSINES